jgi:hypothetical protein
MSGGSFAKFVQKSGVAKDLIEWPRPSFGYVTSRAIQDMAQSPTWL